MADISALGQLQPAEELNLDTYQDVGSGRRPAFQFPKAGRYTLRAPESFPAEAFGRTKSGALSVQIDPTIVGPTNEGLTVRFQRISATTYQRNGQPVSKIGDYLRACGRKGRLSADPQEIADAVSETAGMVYEAQLDWRLYAKGHAKNDSGVLEVRGMDNFPKNENGEPMPYVLSETQTNPETGEPVRLRANLDIVWFYPAN